MVTTIDQEIPVYSGTDGKRVTGLGYRWIDKEAMDLHRQAWDDALADGGSIFDAFIATFGGYLAALPGVTPGDFLQATETGVTGSAVVPLVAATVEQMIAGADGEIPTAETFLDLHSRVPMTVVDVGGTDTAHGDLTYNLHFSVDADGDLDIVNFTAVPETAVGLIGSIRVNCSGATPVVSWAGSQFVFDEESGGTAPDLAADTSALFEFEVVSTTRLEIALSRSWAV